MLAPVVIFAYNRPDHFRKTMQALVLNELASDSLLYVYCDGVPEGKNNQSAREVREIARAITGFKHVQLCFREQNFGCCQSVISGVSEVLKEHSKVIVIEDDLVTSPQFLLYMNASLSHYGNDEHIFSIGGYNVPHFTMPIPVDYPYDTFLGVRNCSWGWGTWADRWSSVDWSLSDFDDFVKYPAAQREFNRGGPDLARMLADQYNGIINTWDVQFCYAHFYQKKYCVYPTQSFVKNIGLDNTGQHCSPDPRREHTELPHHVFPVKFCPGDAIDANMERLFYNTYAPVELRKKWPAFRDGMLAVSKRLYHMARRKFFAPQKVSLLTVNTILEGGAAHAAWRNFCAMRPRWSDAKFLALSRSKMDPAIVGLGKVRSHFARKFARRDRQLLRQYPNYRKETFFSPGVRCTPIRLPLWRFQPEILHLNWISGGMLRIEELLNVDCPIVWTLHDAWAFTGGCHYVGDCQGYRGRCGCCPVLGKGKQNDLSRQLIRRKARVYPYLDLTVVTPSHWLAGLARQSGLFALRRIEVIPNGLDTMMFSVVDHRAAKAYFRLDPKNPVLLYGAQTLDDPRKGGDLLRAALAEWQKPCTLLTFGEGRLELSDCPYVTHRSLGTLHDDVSLALAYSAADIFCCPSREDNFPNTVIEAQSCGTPCLSFRAGGLPEMIAHQIDGYVAEAFSVSDFVAGLHWLCTHPEPDMLRDRARQKAVIQFDQSVTAKRYENLFDDICRAAHERQR